MRGFLHFATDGETLQCSGRDDDFVVVAEEKAPCVCEVFAGLKPCASTSKTSLKDKTRTLSAAFCLLNRAACTGSGGPCPLEVVSAEPAGYIDYLADEVQA
jgi:hypothetical protein